MKTYFKLSSSTMAWLLAFAASFGSTASPLLAGEFYANYRTSYAPSYYSTPTGGGWATYYFPAGQSTVASGQSSVVTSGYAWTGNSCNSCQTASYAVSSCDSCNPCGCNPCGSGSCGTACTGGNCANGNCTTNMAPSGTPTPIAEPTPPRTNPTTTPRNNPPETFEPIPSRNPYTPPPRNTFDEPEITPVTPRESTPPRTTPERDGFTPRNTGSEAPMFDAPATTNPINPSSPGRSSLPAGRDPMIDPMGREPFTPSRSNTPAGSGASSAPLDNSATPMPPMRRPAPTTEPAGGSTEFGGSFRPSYETPAATPADAASDKTGKNPTKSNKAEAPADAAQPDAASPDATKPGSNDSSMKVPAPIDFTPISPTEKPAAEALQLDERFIAQSDVSFQRKPVAIKRTLPALVRTVVRPQTDWERSLEPQISLASSLVAK